MTRLHLPRRFVRALWPGPPRDDDTRWVESILTPAELELWRQLPNHDRRYSIRVARRVEQELVGTAYANDQRWPAAALLHDSGKLDSGFGVFGRSAATITVAIARRVRVSRWRDQPGLRGRIAAYARHDELGAERIRRAGGREEAAQWALAHHHPERWPATGIPRPVAEALKVADDA